jgi:hypothetical protein
VYSAAVVGQDVVVTHVASISQEQAVSLKKRQTSEESTYTAFFTLP